MSRPSWDQYFLNQLDNIGARVSCNRGKCACIFVKDNRTLATGYAGAPPGLPHCLDHDDQLEESCRFLPKDPIMKTIVKIAIPANKSDDESILSLDSVVSPDEKSGIQIVTQTLDPKVTPKIELEGITYEWNEETKRYQSKTKISCVRTVHAEMNAIIAAARFGVCLEGSTLYVSMTCCSNCARAIIGVGVKRVVAAKRYHAGQEAEYLLSQAGIPLDIIDNSVVQYSNQQAK